MNDESKYDMLETKQTNATSGNENLSLKKKKILNWIAALNSFGFPDKTNDNLI